MADDHLPRPLPPDQRVFTVSEAASYLRLGKSWVRVLIRENYLHVVAGSPRKRLISRESLERMRRRYRYNLKSDDARGA